MFFSPFSSVFQSLYGTDEFQFYFFVLIFCDVFFGSLTLKKFEAPNGSKFPFRSLLFTYQ